MIPHIIENTLLKEAIKVYDEMNDGRHANDNSVIDIYYEKCIMWISCSNQKTFTRQRQKI